MAKASSKWRRTTILAIAIGVVAGAIIGGATGYFGRCASGTCPLTSNPYSRRLSERSWAE